MVKSIIILCMLAGCATGQVVGKVPYFEYRKCVEQQESLCTSSDFRRFDKERDHCNKKIAERCDKYL